MNKQRHYRLDLLHSWIGIIIGLLIFIVSFSGVVALFGDEIQTWEDPATRISLNKATVPYTPLVDAFVKETLDELGEGYVIDNIFAMYPHDKAPYYYARISAKHADKPFKQINRHWNPNTGEVIAERGNGLSYWLVAFHRRLMLPNTLGQTIIGIAGILMLISIVGGVVIHRNMFKDLFSWRTHRSLRVGWRESHNALGVWGLPFHFILAFTGAFLGIVSILLPIVAFTAFKGDQDALLKAVFGEEPEAAGISVPMYPLNQARAVVEAAHGKPVVFNTIHHWGDKNATYEIFFEEDKALIIYGHSEMAGSADAESAGQILDTHYAEPDSPAGVAVSMFAPLHFGSYGGVTIKIVYVLLGISLCAMVATGLGLWLERRLYGNEGKQSQLTYALLGRFTVGNMMGLVVCSLALFYADRLYTGSSEHRLVYTGIFFVGVWALCNTIAMFISSNYMTTRLGLIFSGLLLMGLPFFDAATTDFSLLDAGHAYANGTNLTAFIFGLLLLFSAKISPKKRPVAYHDKKQTNKAKRRPK